MGEALVVGRWGMGKLPDDQREVAMRVSVLSRGTAARELSARGAQQVASQLDRARAFVADRVLPTAATWVRTAQAASGPIRQEAVRRSRLVGRALRGMDGAVVAPARRRRWPVAVVFLGIGSAIGAAVAWVLQAGKPVQLAPYPAPPRVDDSAGRNGTGEQPASVAHDESDSD